MVIAEVQRHSFIVRLRPRVHIICKCTTINRVTVSSVQSGHLGHVLTPAPMIITFLDVHASAHDGMQGMSMNGLRLSVLLSPSPHPKPSPDLRESHGSSGWRLGDPAVPHRQHRASIARTTIHITVDLLTLANQEYPPKSKDHCWRPLPSCWHTFECKYTAHQRWLDSAHRAVSVTTQLSLCNTLRLYD